jgi:hypothetical protein
MKCFFSRAVLLSLFAAQAAPSLQNRFSPVVPAAILTGARAGGEPAVAGGQTPQSSLAPVIVDLRSYSGDLAAACNDAVSKGAVLVLNTTTSPAGGLTCAADIFVAVGAKVAPQNSATVTFSTPHVNAPSAGWIDDSHGIVVFTGVREIIADWFGADHTGTADSTQQIDWALHSASLAAPGGHHNPPAVVLLAGVYKTGNPANGPPTVTVFGPGPNGFIDGMQLIGSGKGTTILQYSGPSDAYAVLFDGGLGGISGMNIWDMGKGWVAGVGMIDNGGVVKGPWFQGYKFIRSTQNVFNDVSIYCHGQPGNGIQFGGFLTDAPAAQADQSVLRNGGVSYCPYGVAFLQAGNNATQNTFLDSALGHSHIGIFAGQTEPLIVRGHEIDSEDVNFYQALGSQLFVRDTQTQNSIRQYAGLVGASGVSATFDGLVVNGAGFRAQQSAGGSFTATANVTYTAPPAAAPKVTIDFPWGTNFQGSGEYDSNFVIETSAPHVLVEGDNVVLYDPKTNYFSRGSVYYLDNKPHRSKSVPSETEAQYVYFSARQTETANGLTLTLEGNCKASLSAGDASLVTFSSPCIAPGTVITLPGAGPGGAALTARVLSCEHGTACRLSAPAQKRVAGVTPLPAGKEAWQYQFAFAGYNGVFSIVNSFFGAGTMSVSNNVGAETWISDGWADPIVDPTNHSVFTCNNTILGNRSALGRMSDCAGANLVSPATGSAQK